MTRIRIIGDSHLNGLEGIALFQIAVGEWLVKLDILPMPMRFAQREFGRILPVMLNDDLT